MQNLENISQYKEPIFLKNLDVSIPLERLGASPRTEAPFISQPSLQTFGGEVPYPDPFIQNETETQEIGIVNPRDLIYSPIEGPSFLTPTSFVYTPISSPESHLDDAIEAIETLVSTSRDIGFREGYKQGLIGGATVTLIFGTMVGVHLYNKFIKK